MGASIRPIPIRCGWGIRLAGGKAIPWSSIRLDSNDKSWLDALGHPHSEDLHVVERFRRWDFGHIHVQLIIEDPKTFTRPFTVEATWRLLPDTDIGEYYCAENEKDKAHMARQ
jgi:hypothetical protein